MYEILFAFIELNLSPVCSTFSTAGLLPLSAEDTLFLNLDGQDCVLA